MIRTVDFFRKSSRTVIKLRSLVFSYFGSKIVCVRFKSFAVFGISICDSYTVESLKKHLKW